MEVAKHSQSACLHFPFFFVRHFRMASKEAYLATELDRARGCDLEDSNLAAMIEDYFEGALGGRLSRGRGRPH